MIVGPAQAHDEDFVIDCDEGTLSRGWHLPEVCDGIDNDCDFAADEGLTTDADGVRRLPPRRAGRKKPGRPLHRLPFPAVSSSPPSRIP